MERTEEAKEDHSWFQIFSHISEGQVHIGSLFFVYTPDSQTLFAISLSF